MKKTFEEPEMKTFLLTSDDIMDVLSTEYIDYDETPSDTEYENLPDSF